MNHDRTSLRGELQTVFREIFSDDSLVLEDSMSAADVDGWDSLANINLVIGIERHFGIRLATAEISGLKREGQNVGTLVTLIAAKLGQR